MTYDDQDYLSLSFDKLTVAELLLLKDATVDGDERAVMVPVKQNLAIAGMVLAHPIGFCRR